MSRFKHFWRTDLILLSGLTWLIHLRKRLCMPYLIKPSSVLSRVTCRSEGPSLSAFYSQSYCTFSTRISRSLSSSLFKRWFSNSRPWPKIRKLPRRRKSIPMVSTKQQLSVMPLSRSVLCSVSFSEVQVLKSSAKISSRRATWTQCSRVERNVPFLVSVISESSHKSTKFLKRTSWNLSTRSAQSCTRQSTVMEVQPTRTLDRPFYWYGKYPKSTTL